MLLKASPNTLRTRTEEKSFRVRHGVAELVLRRPPDAPREGGVAVLLAPGLGDHHAFSRDKVAAYLSEKWPTVEVRHGGRGNLLQTIPSEASRQRSANVYKAIKYIIETIKPDLLLMVGHSMGGVDLSNALARLFDPKENRWPLLVEKNYEDKKGPQLGVVYETTPGTHGPQELHPFMHIGWGMARDVLHHPIDYASTAFKEFGRAARHPVEEFTGRLVLGAESVSLIHVDITPNILRVGQARGLHIPQLAVFGEHDEMMVNPIDGCVDDMTVMGVGHFNSWHNPDIVPTYFEPIFGQLAQLGAAQYN